MKSNISVDRSSTIGELLAEVDGAFASEEVDLGIERFDGQALVVLCNHARAFVMRIDMGQGASQVASLPSGDENEWSFALANGQRDTYPDGMTVPREVALAVSRHFVQNSVPDDPPWSWLTT